jgi:hypothetical protein
MKYYLISDEQLNLIDNSEGIEILREGRKNPKYELTMNNDGSYTRRYYSEDPLNEGEVLIHFYGGSREEEEKSFILKVL